MGTPPRGAVQTPGGNPCWQPWGFTARLPTQTGPRTWGLTGDLAQFLGKGNKEVTSLSTRAGTGDAVGGTKESGERRDLQGGADRAATERLA